MSPVKSLATHALESPGSPMFYFDPVSASNRDKALSDCVAQYKDHYYYKDGSSIEWHENGVARITKPPGHYSQQELEKFIQAAAMPHPGLAETTIARLKSLLRMTGAHDSDCARQASDRPTH